MQDIINTEVDSILAEGIIKPSNSKLNSVTEKDAYPLQFIHAIVDKLRAAKYFPPLDLKNSYW